MKKIIIIIFFCLHAIHAYESSVTVFPLVNKSQDTLYNWVSYTVPESFTRLLSSVDGVRVWDPIFMFQTDSLCWRMASDSLLLVHCGRWAWDAAIGGNYTVIGDSIRIDLKIVWVTGTRQHLSMNIVRTTTEQGLPALCTELLLSSCALLKISISSEDSAQILARSMVKKSAYFTFCAGYGMEMTAQYSEAQTAYNHAISIDPECIIARCRAGGIYLRTGNVDAARNIFKHIVHSKHHTHVTMAMNVGFAVDYFPPRTSYKVIEKYRTGLERSAAGLTVIGKWYLTTGEYQRAIAMFRRAIAWGPGNLDSEFLLAMAYMSSGEYAAATELFNHLISIRPDYIRYQVSLGAVYRKDKRHMESLAVLEAARKKEPENTMVLVELAHTSFALSWYRKAGQLLELARRIKPDENDILIDLGIVYWHEKRIADSERCFALAAKESRGKRAVLVNVGNMHLMEGETAKALDAYRKAGNTGKRNPEILYNSAVAYMQRGNKKAAAKYLDQLLQLTPARVDLLVIRARLAVLLGKTEDAEMAYHKILENDPYSDMAVEGLVKLCIEQKKYEEAIYRVESYLEVKPARGDFMMLLGDAYRAQGWYEVALVKYELVTQAFPEYAPGYLGMARSMYDMVVFKNFTRYDDVLYTLKNAAEKSPKSPEPDEMMGDIYWTYKRDRATAFAHWNKAITLVTDTREKKRITKKMQKADKN